MYIYIYDIMGIPEIFQSVRAADFYESGENKGLSLFIEPRAVSQPPNQN